MPKVMINRLQYKVRDIGNMVRFWLIRSGKYEKDLAAQLGISQQGVSQKIRKNQFSYSDLVVIFDFFEVPNEEILRVMKMCKI